MLNSVLSRDFPKQWLVTASIFHRTFALFELVPWRQQVINGYPCWYILRVIEESVHATRVGKHLSLLPIAFFRFLFHCAGSSLVHIAPLCSRSLASHFIYWLMLPTDDCWIYNYKKDEGFGYESKKAYQELSICLLKSTPSLQPGP